MVVMVAIDGEGARRSRPKQAHVLRMLRDCLRNARAAHVTVEAYHAIALSHDDMQIVRDKQNAETPLGPQSSDEGVEFRFAKKVDTAHRFIEDEQLRIAQQRASQDHALQLAA